MELDKWIWCGVVGPQSRTEALKTGLSTFRSSWVGGPFKEKSRCVIWECATYEDPTVFAAACDQNLSESAPRSSST